MTSFLIWLLQRGRSNTFRGEYLPSRTEEKPGLCQANSKKMLAYDAPTFFMKRKPFGFARTFFIKHEPF
jgi:hypothetical protein